MSDLSYRKATLKAVLDLFADATGLPVLLCELLNGRPELIFADRTRCNFTSHCKLLQSSKVGREQCETDQRRRAVAFFNLSTEQPSLCYAGIYNIAIPILVEGKTQAVLFYGQKRVEGQELESLRKHAEAVKQLHLGEKQAAELRARLLEVKTHLPEGVESFKNGVVTLLRYYYQLVNRDENMRHASEKICHEMQIRLQALVANAENLLLEMTTLSQEETVDQTRELLYNALALSTIVQNLDLGAALEEYHFQKVSIAGLLSEAKQLYEVEAARRGIRIEILLHPPIKGRSPILEVSPTHLQYALNNLVHNAVKYSFRGSAGRDRYVRITGSPAGDYYRVAFENYGIGIKPHEIQNGLIFREGYQGELTQGEHRTGSGKGLSFVKRVIETSHGGRIDVESTPMHDSEHLEGQPYRNRFTIILPYEQLRRG